MVEEQAYEEKSSVDAKTLEDILNEKEKERQANIKPPLAKTLLEMYGSNTPTQEVLDYIADQKLSAREFTAGLWMILASLVPAILFEYTFETLGILLFFAMVAFGIIAMVKSKKDKKKSKSTLNNLVLDEDDYDMVNDEFKRTENNKFKLTVTGILLICFSIAPSMIVDELYWLPYIFTLLSQCTAFIMVATGVATLVYNHSYAKIFKKMLKAHQNNK